ncbi:SagB/ThcOx family dehydrogenase [Paludibacteraceae bacterium OttesenSCG-928-F17]|nr:SagB/ThcOx family dehydrogenase [Paludibacteraceae bacterium OttesenSCG-928-F17]
MKHIILFALGLFITLNVSAQDIQLPQPQKTGGMPLMEALNKRSSSRNFKADELDNQTLSNLLWAAWGYNRNDKRTAPSSQNKQEMDLYVVMKKGAYLYDAKNNKLVQVSSQDLRKETGSQDFVAIAPVNVVFVANKDKGGAPKTDSGFISQNIYLFCASEGLGTVVRGWFEAETVSKALKLKANQEVVLTQTVGKLK